MKFNKYFNLFLIGIIFANIQNTSAFAIDVSSYDELKAVTPNAYGDVLNFTNDFNLTGPIGFFPGVFDLKIDGNGHTVTVQNNTAGGFVIYQYVKYEIDNLIYDGNNVALSQAFANPIYNDKGTAILKNSTFKNSYITNSHGGAVYNELAGVLNADKTIFSNNKVGDNYWGGAVANKGTATITGSQFSNNEVSNASGGAIYNSGTITFAASNDGTLTNFSSNKAPGWGGAIYNEGNIEARATFNQNTAGSGGAIFQSNNAYLNIYRNSVFEGNSAASADTINSGGGAIFNQGHMSTVYESGASQVEFNNNTATYSSGGAIYNANQASIDAAFNQNSASFGGAIYNKNTLTLNGGSSFDKNTASSYGGAIYNQATTNITGTSFNGNEAASGGAIWNEAGDLTIYPGSSFVENKATGYAGGAIYNKSNATMTANFSKNEASAGGAIYNTSPSGVLNIYPSSSFSENKANTGGAIYNEQATTNMSDTTFDKNEATASGGAISNASGNLSITRGEFNSNTAGASGGAIFNGGGTTTIQGASFDSNTAATGGAISNSNGTLTISDTDFTNNSATTAGGAIYQDGGVTSINLGKNIEFTGNSAAGTSNDIHIESGTLNVQTNANTLTLNGGLSGAGTVNKLGNGAFNLNGINSNFTGDLNVNGGKLNLGSYKSGEDLISSATNGKMIFANNTTLATQNEIIDNNVLAEFNGNTKFDFNIDTSNDTADTLGVSGNGTVTLNLFKFISGQDLVNDETVLNIFNSNSGTVTLDKGNVSVYTNDFKYSYGDIINGDSITIIKEEFAGDVLANALGDTAAVRGLELLKDYKFETFTNSGGLLLPTEMAAGTLTINGNGHSIDAQDSQAPNNKVNLFTTDTGDTLIVNNVSEIKNANTTGFGSVVNNNGGEVYIANTKIIGNSSARGGGAIYNTNSGKVVLSNTQFVDNTSTGNGGSIYNTNGANLEISSSEFSLDKVNFMNTSGGAIYNDTGANLLINKGTVFKNLTVNISGGETGGGAISNGGNTTIDGTNGAVQFTNNSSYGNGGAITNKTGATLNILKAIFTGNGASVNGGAINNFANLDIKQAIFDNNFANKVGGAINNEGGLAVKLGNILFKSNSAVFQGGAINNSVGDLAVQNTTFINNFAGDGTNNKMGIGGGAIYNETGQTVDVSNSEFISNSSFGSGGAIYNKGELNIKNASFENNSIRDTESTGTSTIGGGAIYNDGGTITLENVSIKDSSVIGGEGIKGGAIYNTNNGTINLISNGQNNVFSNNTLNNGDNIIKNDIHLESGTLNLNVSKGNTFVLGGGITSASDSNEFNINGSASSVSGGQVLVDGIISNTKMNFHNGTLSLGKTEYISGNHLGLFGGQVNMGLGSVSTAYLNSLHLENGTKTGVAINADLANSQVDRFSTNNATGTGTLDINGIRILTDSKGNTTQASFADSSFRDNVTLGTDNAYSPMYKYGVEYMQENGNLAFTRQGFRPGVISGPVAAQVGAYLVQLNNYTDAFRNMDMVLLLPKEQRQALLYRNKTATVGSQYAYSPTMFPEEKRGFWTRPFTTFENVPLKNGPTVSNVLYGSLFGEDSQLKDIGHGFKGFHSIYLGYNGSHQTYDGVGIYQNGGVIGATYQVYKNNFFSGLTMNVGGSTGEASNEFGRDNFAMLSTGIASKTGYNWKLLDEKLVVQPNLLMSYSFIQTFNYTTASGVEISNGALNAVQVTPGIKIIGNLKNYWQPYLAVNMVFNAFDKAAFMANETYLPQLSIKPYIEYGLGVQKRWGEKFTGFTQFMIRNGGRNGVALQFGFRWALGK